MDKVYDIRSGKQPATVAGRLEVQLVHRIGGRDRLRIAAIRNDSAFAGVLVRALDSAEGVRRVRCNRAATSLVVEYSDASVQQDLESILASATGLEVQLHGNNPAPNERHQPTPGSVGVRSKDRHTQPKKPAPADSDSRWHRMTLDDVVAELEANLQGLSTSEALRRLQEDGGNTLTEMARRSDLHILLEQFKSAPVAMLGVSAAIALLSAAPLDAAVIAVVVGTNAAIGFLTERQAEETIASMASVEGQQAKVLRDGRVLSITADEVVRGDILVLEPGLHIPADARLVSSRHLSVDESTLTGESMPVKKKAADNKDKKPLADRRNVVHLGTTVTGGDGRAVVVEVGDATELGLIQSLASGTEQPMTPMQSRLSEISTQLAIVSSAICGLVFVIGLMRGQPRLAMLNTAISLAVAAVPEGLPAISNSLLALGIRRMRERNVLARKIDAIENLGAIDVLCIDKTGTLTENNMRVVELAVRDQRIEMPGPEGKAGAKIRSVDPRFWQVLTLCNESEVDGGEYRGSSTENALLQAAVRIGTDVEKLRCQMPRQKVSYRSDRRQYMVSVHAYPRKKGFFAAVKGRPTQVLARCTHYRYGGRRIRLTDKMRQRIRDCNKALMAEAYRVLGVAWRHQTEDKVGKVEELEWLGLAAMADPLRPEVHELLPMLREAGIRPVILTGDQRGTAAAVGRQLGLNGDDDVEVLSADEIEDLSEESLRDSVNSVQVFARVSPAMKLRLVQVLQAAGHRVAMTGDGINDGPALKAADVGIAMGRDGTEVARSMSDVVLTDDRLQSILDAIAYGRGSYANMEKAIEYLLSTNFSEIEVMLAAVATGVPSPLTPMQLLWINLITDVFPALAIGFEEPEWDVLKQPPSDAGAGVLSGERIKQLFKQSLPITTGTSIAYFYGLARYGAGPQARTQAFMTLTLAQLLQSLSSRTHGSTIFSKHGKPPNPWLKRAVVISVLSQLGTALPGVRRLLGVSRPGLIDLLVIAGGAITPVLLNEVLKQRRLQAQEAAE